jgi:thiamine-phosphate pyrophosphorylase
LPALLLLTDAERLPDPVSAAAKLPRGGRNGFAAGVVVRERERAKQRTLARALAPICRARRAALLVAGDPRLAREIGATGVHLSEEAARAALLSTFALPRKAARRGMILSVAAHSLRAILRANALHADIVLLAPAFATASHPGATPIGAIRFARMIRAAARTAPDIRVFALGGVTGDNAARLMRAGAAGFAAIGALA